MKKRKLNKFVIPIVIIDVIGICLFVCCYLIKPIGDRLITTSMNTFTHRYIARTLYSEEYIEKALKRNVTVEPKTNGKKLKIKIDSNEDTGVYSSVYEEQILKRDKGNDLYKVIELHGSTWDGWMVAIYDPSRIKAFFASDSKKGRMGTQVAKDTGAKIVINGGGFGKVNGVSIPSGMLVVEGKTLFDNSKKVQMIGINKKNVLVLGYYTARDAVNNLGIRDAMVFGPFLVVDGIPASFSGDGGYGKRSRTAIGQRQDGTILLLVIDGKYTATGASMPELTDIFMKYGAVNAANLDGGGSSTLVVEGKLVNNPIGWGYSGERYLIDGWIVK